MKEKSFDHRETYKRGKSILQAFLWKPVLDGMFKPPSSAKGTPMRLTCEKVAAEDGLRRLEVTESALLASRIDHLLAIGGESTKQFLLNELCTISRDEIARLCRRMPPFVAAKLKELEAGGTDIDSNPTGAFDTYGWSELRVRLPKFRATLQHYSQQCTTSAPGAAHELDTTSSVAVLNSILSECDALIAKIRTFVPSGTGAPRQSKPIAERTLPWSHASTRLSQALGVLRKTNRDLSSEHWRKDWRPTHADLKIILQDVQSMREAAAQIERWLESQHSRESARATLGKLISGRPKTEISCLR